jgi:alpha-tubulin suppressor-like RCC1 family protein
VLPREIEALHGVDVASVSAGGYALALSYSGGVYSWGFDGPALGHGTPSIIDEQPPTRLPTRIEALRGVRMRCVAAGQTHCCAVTDEGHVHIWGEGQTGALGHMNFREEPLRKRVESLSDGGVFAVGVAAGDHHTLVADTDGAVWGFGYLNAIGAWSDPTLKAVRDAGFESVEANGGGGGLIGRPGYHSDPDLPDGTSGKFRACFHFLFPQGHASICTPVRVPVHVRVSG